MKVVKDVVYDPAYAPATVGDLYLPDTVTADTQLVLNIHGGGWSSLDRSRTVGISEFLVENNCIVYNIDYRLTTQSPWPACGDDCLKAADFLLNGDIPELAGVKRDKIGVIGGSAGGHLAMMTGLRFRNTSWIVSISGVLDPIPSLLLEQSRHMFINFFGWRITMENLRTAFPETYLDPATAPRILCTHMLTDTVVPDASTVQFAATAAKRGITVEKMLYDPREGLTGHGIWNPDRTDLRLLPELEARISEFIKM